MPEYEIVLRYRQEWTATKRLRARSEEAAQEKIEQDLAQITDYTSFARYVSEDSTPELDDESIEVDEIHER